MARQTNIIILIFSLIFWSCGGLEQKSTKAHNSNDKDNFTDLKFVNKFENESVQENVKQITTAEFSPVYIGEIKKEINLVYDIKKIGNRVSDLRSYDDVSKNSIIISIDTTRNLPSPPSILPTDKLAEDRDKINILSYPVFIQNVSKDTIQIGFGDIFPIIIEAKNEKGLWQPIQNKFMYFCGTGLTMFFLAPNQTTITTMKQFSGTFKTELRIVYLSKDKIYSNTIKGFINPEQFE